MRRYRLEQIEGAGGVVRRVIPEAVVTTGPGNPGDLAAERTFADLLVRELGERRDFLNLLGVISTARRLQQQPFVHRGEIIAVGRFLVAWLGNRGQALRAAPGSFCLVRQ